MVIAILKQWTRKVVQLVSRKVVPTWEAEKQYHIRHHNSLVTLQGLQLAEEHLRLPGRSEALTGHLVPVKRSIVIATAYLDVETLIDTLTGVLRRIQARDDLPSEMLNQTQRYKRTLDDFLTDKSDHRLEAGMVAEVLCHWVEALRLELQSFETTEPDRFAYVNRRLYHLYETTFNALDGLIELSYR